MGGSFPIIIFNRHIPEILLSWTGKVKGRIVLHQTFSSMQLEKKNHSSDEHVEIALVKIKTNN